MRRIWNDKKALYLSEKDIELLQSIKKENNFKSDGQTVSYLLKKYTNKTNELAVSIREELEKNYLPKERIRWGVKTAEENSILILDALNSLLWNLKINQSYRFEDIPHSVLKESQEEMKRKIAYFKQKSDERKSKQSEN